MTGLTFTFTGPDGQHVAAVGGVVVVEVRDPWTLFLLEDAAAVPFRVTVTGPFTGGHGLEDPTSAFYAAREIVPGWAFTGEAPPVPEVPPVDPGVVYTPPS